MPAISKTGLLPSSGCSQMLATSPQITTFEAPKICRPAPYVLRPFAGVYNPFPYGCSVLCNHPADCEAKDVVKKAKDTWAQEGRPLAAVEGGMAILSHRPPRCESRRDDGLAAVPEELFRKYTETDSRPITPAPTVASIVTRSSQVRRCVTPDLMGPRPGQERTMLVLDLRRSHSQETLNWFGACPPMPPTAPAPPPSRPPSRSVSSVSAASPPASRKKKSSAKGRQSSAVQEDADEPHDADTEASIKLKQQVLSNVKTLDATAAITDRTAGSSGGGDADVVKRRGKKKKGRKASRDQNKEGEKEFQGIPDPGETQVSTLGESRGGSTRPSLTPGAPADAAEPPPAPDAASLAPTSFLPAHLLKQLQRQLDQETVESVFDGNRKLALEEALRTRSPAKLRHQSEELKAIKKELSLSESSTHKWLSLPRVFSRKSSRFEVPMDSYAILRMSCLDYASQCVFPSTKRLVLYNQVFNMHREELDEDEQVERTLLGKNVLACLDLVMGRALSDSERSELLLRLSILPSATLDFRTFAGVAAVCERLLGTAPSRDSDPPHTLEVADFRSLHRLQALLPHDSAVSQLLQAIKDS